MTTAAAFLSPEDVSAVTTRETRATDLTKVNVPMPFMITLVAISVGFAAGVWRIESKVSVIETAINYERQLDTERAQRSIERDADYRRYIDQRFETLEAKIETAGVRNSAMALSTELQKRNK